MARSPAPGDRDVIDNSVPLYLSEREIALRVVGTGGVKRWPGIAAVLEREGLPRVDPLIGARFWPSVRAFLFKRARVDYAVYGPPDGKEDWSRN